ncbi:MAG: LysR family transcriptional regulator [Rubricoccaceae bacterium]
MEIRQIECFVAVAEERHFGRAAERVHLSQSALSRQIQRLEADLDVSLLDRTTRQAQLTAAGRAFLRDAREVLRWTVRARNAAKAAAEGRAGTLRLGFVSSAAADLLPRLLGAFRAQAPDATVHLVERYPDEILDALRAREIDFGISRGPFMRTDGLVVQDLKAEPLVVLMPAGHALSTRDAIPLRELATQSFVLPPRGNARGYLEAIYALCASAGFVPTTAEEAEPMATLVALVAAGLGITLAPESVGRQAQRVVCRPLTDLPNGLAVTTCLSVVWRAGDLPPVAEIFRGVAIEQETVR